MGFFDTVKKGADAFAGVTIGPAYQGAKLAPDAAKASADLLTGKNPFKSDGPTLAAPGQKRANQGILPGGLKFSRGDVIAIARGESAEPRGFSLGTEQGFKDGKAFSRVALFQTTGEGLRGSPYVKTEVPASLTNQELTTRNRVQNANAAVDKFWTQTAPKAAGSAAGNVASGAGEAAGAAGSSFFSGLFSDVKGGLIAVGIGLVAIFVAAEGFD